jgi:hypothetical protein
VLLCVAFVLEFCSIQVLRSCVKVCSV